MSADGACAIGRTVHAPSVAGPHAGLSHVTIPQSGAPYPSIACCDLPMTFPLRRPAPARLFGLFALACGLALPATAHAEACPGSGPAPACPYASAAIVGERAESVLRFPEAVAVDAAGDVYVADQLSYVVQKFN